MASYSSIICSCINPFESAWYTWIPTLLHRNRLSQCNAIVWCVNICMGSVCQCASGPQDELRWTSQLPVPAYNGPELRRGKEGKSGPGYTQTHILRMAKRMKFSETADFQWFWSDSDMFRITPCGHTVCLSLPCFVCVSEDQVHVLW